MTVFALVLLLGLWPSVAMAADYDYCCSLDSPGSTSCTAVPYTSQGCLGGAFEGFDLTTTDPSSRVTVSWTTAAPHQGLCRAKTSGQQDPDDCLELSVNGDQQNVAVQNLWWQWGDPSFAYYQLCYGSGVCSPSGGQVQTKTPSGSCCTPPEAASWGATVPAGPSVEQVAMPAEPPVQLPGFSCSNPQPAGAACGPNAPLVPDGCGHPIEPDCAGSLTCDHGSCCAPTDCATAGYQCGTLVTCGSTTSCGSCPSGQSCVSNLCCAPNPQACAQQHPGATCGVVSDGCGGQSVCGAGTCLQGQHCGASLQCLAGAAAKPTPAAPLAALAWLGSMLFAIGAAAARRT